MKRDAPPAPSASAGSFFFIHKIVSFENSLKTAVSFLFFHIIHTVNKKSCYLNTPDSRAFFQFLCAFQDRLSIYPPFPHSSLYLSTVREGCAPLFISFFYAILHFTYTKRHTIRDCIHVLSGT